MAAAQAVQMVGDAEEAAALFHPLRLRLLAKLSQPGSATSLAKDIGLPRQKINYHLRELERVGLVEFVEERRRGNCMERIVRATARSYLVNPEALGSLAADPDKVQDRFSAAYMVAAAARTIRDLAVLQRRADKAGKRLATFNLLTEVRFASAVDRNAFTEALSNEMARLVAKYNNDKAPGGRLFRFYVGAYPAITRDEDGRPIPRKRKDSATKQAGE